MQLKREVRDGGFEHALRSRVVILSHWSVCQREVKDVVVSHHGFGGFYVPVRERFKVTAD